MTQYQRGLCWYQWEVMSICWTHIVNDIALNNLALDKNQTTLPTFYYLISFDIHRRFSLNQTNWMKTFVVYSFHFSDHSTVHYSHHLVQRPTPTKNVMIMDCAKQSTDESIKNSFLFLIELFVHLISHS